MNSGNRLLTIYESLTSQNPEHKMRSIWADVFNTSSHTEDQISSLLISFREEIDHTQSKLTDIYEVPPQLYDATLQTIKSISSTSLIETHWKNHKGNVATPEHRKVIQWISWVLRNEKEGMLTEEEINELEEELNSFEILLQDSEITPYLRDFIRRNIKSIKDALRSYPVRGVDPIIRSIETAGGALRANAAKIKKEMEYAGEKPQNALQKLTSFVSNLAHKCDEFNSIKEAGESLTTLASSVTEAIQACSSNAVNLLSSPSVLST